MKNIFAILAFIMSAIVASGQTDTNVFFKPRTWTTRSGKQVRAIYVRQDAEMAVLRDRNGQELQIKKELLDKDNQSFLDSIYNFENPPPILISFVFPKQSTNEITLVEISEINYGEQSDPFFPFTAKWTTFALPVGDEEKNACRQINTELKQISKALDIGISYNNFANLLQEVVLNIERIKDTSPTLPENFLERVDKCIAFYTDSREAWHTSIFREYFKTESEFLRGQCWENAFIQFLYCQAVAQNDPKASVNILVKTATRIFTYDKNKTIPDEKYSFVKKPENINLSKMNYSEIYTRVNNLAAHALPPEARVSSESVKEVEQGAAPYGAQGAPPGEP